ncbi:MAG: methyltransferase [Limimaricola sp.]|nr:methyltransferase [Limimaricola sp.]
MGGPPPYFAYPWAGGIALARYLLANPGLVAGRAVADIGAGSGLVSIAALQAGAAGATAHDCDTRALATVRLNARANGVTITTCLGDALSGPLPDAPVILIGDLFYDDALACGTLAFARACAGAGRLVLIGDPGRAPLPLAALRLLAEHEVPDMGDSPGKTRSAGVYTLRD